jgi:hypothetical protein
MCVFEETNTGTGTEKKYLNAKTKSMHRKGIQNRHLPYPGTVLKNDIV